MTPFKQFLAILAAGIITLLLWIGYLSLEESREAAKEREAMLIYLGLDENDPGVDKQITELQRIRRVKDVIGK